jgi:hypothetical protein
MEIPRLSGLGAVYLFISIEVPKDAEEMYPSPRRNVKEPAPVEIPAATEGSEARSSLHDVPHAMKRLR